jgi:hypothetical protein
MVEHFDEPQGEARKSAESASKPRLDLLPPPAMEAIAEVLTFGASKYGANNWCRGARWGRYYAALRKFYLDKEKCPLRRGAYLSGKTQHSQPNDKDCRATWDVRPNTAKHGVANPMTHPLSPAAQAVEAAILKVASLPGFERRRIIAAAALRAAADHVVPDEPYCSEDDSLCEYLRRTQRQETRARILAIAAELERANA